jgi:hypothetical protein
MENPQITTLDFPEGKFDLIWCLIGQTDGEEIISTFEAFIAVNFPDVNFDSKVSDELRRFDETRIYAYAHGLSEFENLIENGGWDFKILDYERSLP